MGYTSEQLSDIQCIRDVAHRYCQGVDRLDLAVMKSAYWADGTDDHGTFVGNAHEFCERVVGSHGRWRATMHCILNHHITLNADGVTANGEIYNVAYLFSGAGVGDVSDGAAGETQNTWFGRYVDRYEKRGDEWRILERVCVHEATRTEQITPMAIRSELFRQGSSDRG